MVSFREWIYNYLNWELKSSQPLWTLQEGLSSIISDKGKIKQIDAVKIPFAAPLISNVISLSEQSKRKLLFDNIIIKDSIKDLKGKILVSNVRQIAEKKTDLMIANRNKYLQISRTFPTPIQWYHIALIHEMECSQNFNCYLGNGQPLNKKTTIVPKNRGPFSSFLSGAIDAIKYDKLDKVQDWSIGNTLYLLEGFNGYGYSLYKGINSPYLWSGTNQYSRGKYIADNVYSDSTVSNQIGIAVLIKVLSEKISLSPML